MSSRQLFFRRVSAVIGVVITYYFYSQGERPPGTKVVKQHAWQPSRASKLLEAQLQPLHAFQHLANLRVLIGMDPQRAQAMLDHIIAYLRSPERDRAPVATPCRDEFCPTGRLPGTDGHPHGCAPALPARSSRRIGRPTRTRLILQPWWKKSASAWAGAKVDGGELVVSRPQPSGPVGTGRG